MSIPVLEYRSARRDDLQAVKLLLAANALPNDDMEAHLDELIVAVASGRILGAAAIELYPPIGLLRSVVVSPHYRGLGVGKKLFGRIKSRALKDNIASLLLLTTSAVEYFEKLGFRIVERETAPPAIRATAQFSMLCPDTAVLMRLALGRCSN